jgi:5-formyltetrahydrofolate cyclo-ligase
MPVSQRLTKSGIRKQILALREQLAPDKRVAYSAAISTHIIEMENYRRSGAILGYMSFGAEFISDLWIQHVLTDGKKLALPRVNHHTNQLDLYWVEDLENQLAAGLWGIREPIVERCERLNMLNEVEFALLPGVAFTRDGARLGYGGGYYDKLLGRQGGDIRAHQPVLAAAAFALQIVEQIPQENTDMKVDWIITEQETIACPDQE